jgi:hypothetical protein
MVGRPYWYSFSMTGKYFIAADVQQITFWPVWQCLWATL